MNKLLAEALDRLPLVAILRGLEPERAADIARILVDAGFGLIEVPLNSPDPFTSIAAIAREVGGRAIVGAGTVLSASKVQEVVKAGGRLIVAPNVDAAVLAAAEKQGCIAIPGFFTPTEALAALAAGADALKLFPAEGAKPAYLKAVKAILPAATPVLAVGGISPVNMQDYWAAGAAGFGIGSALFRPGKDLADIGRDAKLFVAAAGALPR